MGDLSPETSTTPSPSPSPSPEPLSPELSGAPGPSSISQRRGRGSGRGSGRGRGSGTQRGRGGKGSSSSTAGMEEQEWSNSLAEVVVEPFERDIGPTIPITADPTDMFLKFFTPQLIQHIITETNRYAATCISTSVPSSGPVQDWSTSEEEIRAYLGFCVSQSSLTCMTTGRRLKLSTTLPSPREYHGRGFSRSRGLQTTSPSPHVVRKGMTELAKRELSSTPFGNPS